jgi:hypothetical protein
MQMDLDVVRMGCVDDKWAELAQALVLAELNLWFCYYSVCLYQTEHQ